MRGARIHYSGAELAFIEARQAMTRVAIHAAFVAAFDRPDVTVQHIKALCTRRGWTTRVPFTRAEDEQLRTHYADTKTETLALQMGRPAHALYHRAQTLDLKKSAAYLASPEAGRLQRGSTVGRATQYQKGATPLNKGIKRPEGWAPGRMKDTQWTKGQPGWNWKPIGSERTIGGYRYTKIGDTRGVVWTKNWKATHIVRWEALHGPLPDGDCLLSVDGDPQNVDPSNWTQVSRSILPRLNGGRGSRLAYHDAPTELKPIVLTVAQLEHAARRRKATR